MGPKFRTLNGLDKNLGDSPLDFKNFWVLSPPKRAAPTAYDYVSNKINDTTKYKLYSKLILKLIRKPHQLSVPK